MIHQVLLASIKYKTWRLGLVEIFLTQASNLTKNISTKPSLTYFKLAAVTSIDDRCIKLLSVTSRNTSCKCQCRPSVCLYVRSRYNFWTDEYQFFEFSLIYSIGHEYLQNRRWVHYMTSDMVKSKALKFNFQLHAKIRVNFIVCIQRGIS